MRESVFEDRKENDNKMTRYYSGVRILCDKCGKVLTDSKCKAIVPYFNVSTHYRSNGMEVLDSYRRYDYCSEECLMESVSKYLDEVREYSNEREIHIHYTGDIR